MAHKPKRHRLIVEITDMTGEHSTKRMRQLVQMFFDDCIYAENSPLSIYDVQNIQVKDARRVQAAADHQLRMRRAGA